MYNLCMINFVGAGPGAVDLISLRGKTLIEKADVIIYAGSLVNPGLLEFAKEGAEIYDSAKMTLEEVLDVMKAADSAGKDVVRLHTGDQSIYGAIREQMDALDKLGIAYDSCPGITAACAAASSLDLEFTLPDISQTLIITRMEGRTPVPEKEKIEDLKQRAGYESREYIERLYGTIFEVTKEHEEKKLFFVFLDLKL